MATSTLRVAKVVSRSVRKTIRNAFKERFKTEAVIRKNLKNQFILLATTLAPMQNIQDKTYDMNVAYGTLFLRRK